LGIPGTVEEITNKGDVKIRYSDGAAFFFNSIMVENVVGVSSIVRIRTVSHAEAAAAQAARGFTWDTERLEKLGQEGQVVAISSEGDIRVAFTDGFTATWSPEMIEDSAPPFISVVLGEEEEEGKIEGKIKVTAILQFNIESLIILTYLFID